MELVELGRSDAAKKDGRNVLDANFCLSFGLAAAKPLWPQILFCAASSLEKKKWNKKERSNLTVTDGHSGQCMVE
ncbi:MAG: hypothetical protein ABI643_00130 [Candidatus Doudnabacteria bacterium]